MGHVALALTNCPTIEIIGRSAKIAIGPTFGQSYLSESHNIALPIDLLDELHVITGFNEGFAKYKVTILRFRPNFADTIQR
ncbi:MAG: hypothetical protein ACI89J_001259 [Hyphomicrobiaceae bacterium]|jgi:hypothetical protein